MSACYALLKINNQNKKTQEKNTEIYFAKFLFSLFNCNVSSFDFIGQLGQWSEIGSQKVQKKIYKLNEYEKQKKKKKCKTNRISSNSRQEQMAVYTYIYQYVH